MTLPIDYIFIDYSRLVSYFQQVSEPADLLKKDKIPNWDISMSVAGPKVGGKQTVYLRDPTVYEMIQSVESYLDREKILETDLKMIDAFHDRVFARLKITARKALIPSKARVAIEGLDHLAVWIRDYKECLRDSVSLYLIEACSESDQPYISQHTGYSALQFLLYDIEDQTKEFRASLLDTDISEELYSPNNIECFKKFTSDPSRYLEILGACLGPPKSIECLIRIRLVFRDFLQRSRMTGIVGYPLYIAS